MITIAKYSYIQTEAVESWHTSNIVVKQIWIAYMFKDSK